MSATVKILIEGFTNADSIAETGEERNQPTITLVRDGDIVMVVDPGVLKSQQVLIDALREEGLQIKDVNLVCITHSHIDHYRNVGMFPEAKTLEYFGLWHENTVEEWQEQFSANIQIARTPGHDNTSITPFVTTEEGMVAICGDVFWKADYPVDDRFATDQDKLNQSRDLVLRMADWIIPGHGGMYKTDRTHIWDEETGVAKPKVKNSVTCQKCRRVMTQIERCLCRPWLCYRCCECHLDCDLCGCSHR